MSEPIKNRYDFVVLFDVENGNPNGDPDAGNMPRVDPETGHGIVTDVCLKRKIRNYVEIAKEDEPGYGIYIKEGITLESNDKRAYKYLEIDENKIKMAVRSERDAAACKIRNFMCENFYDIRTFGAVMTTFTKTDDNDKETTDENNKEVSDDNKKNKTNKKKNGLNCGQVRGPVQLGFARSIDSVVPQELAIIRTAITTEKDAENKKTEFGGKWVVPYGLYRAEGYVSANLARKTTGFSEEDLELLWQAIMNMFENDRSAARGKMITRKLIIFKHSSELGNAPAHKLFDLVKVERIDKSKPARSYADYTVTVDKSAVPEGVSIECRD